MMTMTTGQVRDWFCIRSVGLVACRIFQLWVWTAPHTHTRKRKKGKKGVGGGSIRLDELESSSWSTLFSLLSPYHSLRVHQLCHVVSLFLSVVCSCRDSRESRDPTLTRWHHRLKLKTEKPKRKKKTLFNSLVYCCCFHIITGNEGVDVVVSYLPATSIGDFLSTDKKKEGILFLLNRFLREIENKLSLQLYNGSSNGWSTTAGTNLPVFCLLFFFFFFFLSLCLVDKLGHPVGPCHVTREGEKNRVSITTKVSPLPSPVF